MNPYAAAAFITGLAAWGALSLLAIYLDQFDDEG